MVQITIDQVLVCRNLPSLPSVAMDVLALTSKGNVNLNEIASVVHNDQGLTAKILRTVNSSYYGLSKPCPTITRAISYLGLSTVKSLVLGFSLVDTTRESAGFSIEDYWRRAVYGGAAAKRVAAATSCGDPEEALIAGLMQDIGMPAIHAAWGAGYATLLGKVGASHAPLAAAETAALGFDHCQAGARLGEKWRLPEEMVVAIRHHHAPETAPAHRDFVRCVALGAIAAQALSVDSPAVALNHLRIQATKWFRLADARIDDLLAQVSDDARDIGRLFRVSTGATPNVQQILAQAEEASLRHQFDVQRETETLRRTNCDLARMALTDGLTGAGNRNFFDTELNRLLAQCRASCASLAVIMVDVDRFKSLNDTHGHQAGDAVLAEMAWRMKSAAAMSKGALLCRYGGEEFAVLLPDTDRRAAARLAEELRRAIADAPVIIRNADVPVPSVSVTISLGVAIYEPGAASRLTTPDLLVQAADKSLYAAKDGGRNCVRIFSDRSSGAIAA